MRVLISSLVLSAGALPALAAEPTQPLGAALVLQDQVALRSAARESAPAQAQLWRGEAVEIRGERLDHYQVYDYRRERGGYVRKSQLLRTGATPADAAELLAALRVLRQQPGSEGLGLGLAAAYVQAAPPAALAAAPGIEALDALGSLAERIAERASQGTPASKFAEAQLSAQLDVAARYGLRFNSYEQAEGRVQLCYEGEAFRRVLALPSQGEVRARAALALTRPDCLDPQAHPREREARDAWRAEVLGLVELGSLPVHWKNRVLMRRASVWASLAFARARRSEAEAASAAGQALADFASVQPGELAEEDSSAYKEAAMRVNAVRWAAAPQPEQVTLGGLLLSRQAGAAGEGCLLVQDVRRAGAEPLLKRCSYGLLWLASASLNREGTAIALAAQPADGWRELWVLRKAGKAGAWSLQVLPPAVAAPGLGYAEFAGWVPGGQQVLIAREARAEERYKRSYELLNLDTLNTERQAGEARALGAFQRWQEAAWRRDSLAAR